MRGITPASDLLVKEMDIKERGGGYKPLGPWLLTFLRLTDKTRRGAVHPERAAREYLMELDRQEKERQEKELASERELGERFAKDCVKYAGDLPRSQEIHAGHIQ